MQSHLHGGVIFSAASDRDSQTQERVRAAVSRVIFTSLPLPGVKGMVSASVGWWQYSLINGQLPTSSHNYSFQIIKLGTLNVKRERSDSSNQLL